MFLVQQITQDPLQQQTLVLSDGTSLTLTIYFRPMQYGWFINELTYKNFVVHGIRITNSPNILYQFQNQIPFGLGCFSSANREPTQQQDFSSGASKLYLLSAEECVQYAEFLKGD